MKLLFNIPIIRGIYAELSQYVQVNSMERSIINIILLFSRYKP